ADAGERGELMKHAVDLDRGDGGALERAEEHPAERVTESHPEAALQRLGDEGGAAAAIAPALLLLERVGLLQFLPVLCVDGHLSSCPRAAASAQFKILSSFPRKREPTRNPQTRR